MLRQLKALAGAALLLPVLCASSMACSLVVIGGTLGLSANGKTYSSELGLGAVVTVASTVLDGSFTITISPPTLLQSPVGFVQTSLEQKSSGVIGSNNMNFDYSSGQLSRSFPAQLLSAQIITVHHRLTANAFPSGTYRTKSVVTCS